MSRKNKSVSFNPKDPFEKEMLDHAKTLPNFSDFMKKLYLNYLQGGITQKDRKKTVSTPNIDQPTINQDYMRQLI